MTLCCDITPGHLRVPVTIYEKQRTDDGAGGSVDTLVEVASARSKWKHSSMGERLHAQSVQAHVMHRVWMRYNPNIKADMILEDPDGARFNIRGVVDIERRRRWLELHVEEGVAT